MIIDYDGDEFKKELKKTEKFTDKVVDKLNLNYNENTEINKSIQFGLTVNMIKHGKRYCPCFTIKNDKNDRVCPCKPALEDEIPNKGCCHCQIFCKKS